MEEIFGKGGLIAKHHKDYEYRLGQIKMAEAVLRAFEEKKHLIVEAGTGTGKNARLSGSGNRRRARTEKENHHFDGNEKLAGATDGKRHSVSAKSDAEEIFGGEYERSLELRLSVSHCQS